MRLLPFVQQITEPQAILDCPRCQGSGFAGPCPECHGTDPKTANQACDTCLGLGGYGSCGCCAGTGRSDSTPHERATMKILELAIQRRLH